MRALLVGAGGMGRTWAKNLAEHGEVELAGWVDVIPGQVETASEMVGLSPMPDSLSLMGFSSAFFVRAGDDFALTRRRAKDKSASRNAIAARPFSMAFFSRGDH